MPTITAISTIVFLITLILIRVEAKKNTQYNTYIKVLFTLVSVSFLTAIISVVVFGERLSSKEKRKIKPEYIIDIKSEDSVLIKADDTVYKVRLDQIEETILKDNL